MSLPWLGEPAASWQLPDGATGASGEITRPPGASWDRLVRGQRVTLGGRRWRVTEVSARPDGTETYRLEPAEAVAKSGVLDPNL